MLADYITPEFAQDLQVKSPQQIVQDYGTHVMVDIYTAKWISYSSLKQEMKVVTVLQESE